MSARLATRFTNSDGTEDLVALFFQSPNAETVTLRVYNDSSVTINNNFITAHRGDLLEGGLTITGESESASNGLGEEIVEETWLEISTNNVDWNPVDAWANKFSIGAISAGGYVTIYVRLNPPASYDSRGMIAFAIGCASTNEEPPIFADYFNTYGEGAFIGDDVPPSSVWFNFSGSAPISQLGVYDMPVLDGRGGLMFVIATAAGTANPWIFLHDLSAYTLPRYLDLYAAVYPNSGTNSAAIGFYGVSGSFGMIAGLEFAAAGATRKIKSLVEGEAQQDLSTFDFQKWYNVKIVFDTTNNTFNVYLNGSLIGSGLSANTSLPLNRLRIGNNAPGAQDARFASVRLVGRS